MKTLAVDIGGTSIKVLTLDAAGQPTNERQSDKTPMPGTPDAVLGVVASLASTQPDFERVSVGFPGVVKNGVAYNAPNLGSEYWDGIPIADLLAERLSRPTRVVNDADLQGLGVIIGEGVELVLTFGTGMGGAIFSEGHLVPNLELGHHAFREGHSYEDEVRDDELKKVGAEEWTARVHDALQQLTALFNYDTLHVGGGNLQHLTVPLPDGTHTFSLEEAMRGAIRLWD